MDALAYELTLLRRALEVLVVVEAIGVLTTVVLMVRLRRCGGA